ncbi:rhamnan synthesis F family protein [Martelella mangrovi]|uniref:Glycosyltransferase involved in cell wall biosynthesis n=1 Tax=Martelella mangrovi TaxID=1397477 RepID=A0ABV2IH66_9HYPH
MHSFLSTHAFEKPEKFLESAWLGHAPFAFHLVANLKPRMIVELGTHNGFSYFCFCQTIRKNNLGTKAYAVDTWQGDEHAGFYGEDVFSKVLELNTPYESFSSLMRMTFSEAVQYFPDGEIDLLHIDGRHLYEDVKRDFEEWAPKLSPNAVVLFHDTNVREREFGVWRFFRELGEKYPAFEFYHQHGLGIIAMGEVPECLKPFFEASRNEAELARSIYASLGSSVVTLSNEENRRVVVERNLEEQKREKASIVSQLGQANMSVAEAERRLDEKHRILDAKAEAIEFTEQKIQTLEERLSDLFIAKAQLLDELEHHKAGEVDLSQRLQVSNDRLARLETDLTFVTGRLQRARRRPFTLFRDLFLYWLLKFLAKLSPPLSKRRTARFAKSAAKRNPKRDPLGTSASVAGPPVTVSAYTNGFVSPQPQRECVLVISHEATRTGAPILSLNIINELSKTYDVISVTLLGGPLDKEFKKSAFANIELDRNSMSNAEIANRIFELAKAVKPSFAILNSVACYQTLDGLNRAEVPAISLVHEFASNLLVYPYFSEIVDKSDKVIFSTELTLSNFLELDHACRPLKVDILPQGLTKPPSNTIDAYTRKAEALAIERACGNDPDEIVIIGIGTIDYRKGPDVFIEVARKMREQAPSKTFRFVWVGDGLDIRGAVFPRFLVDQVKRSQLQAHFHFVPAMSDLDKLFELADALVICSRLDPLPNVGIDMLNAGKPMFCFDRTTGFSELLHAADFEACVAEYYDSNDLAAKLVASLPTKEVARKLGAEQQKKLMPLFDMGDYVRRLENIGKGLQAGKSQFQDDLNVIASSGLFRRDFYNLQDRKVPDRELIGEYIRVSKAGRRAIKALPGFHPFIFAKERDVVSTRDPLAQYIEEGCPSGPWKHDVIDEESAIDIDAAKTLKSALHIHAYYPEMLDNIIDRLNQNEILPDIFISTRAELEPAAVVATEKYRGATVSVRAFPNIGRDIGPLLTGFGSKLVNYDVVGHIHTKKSLHVESRDTIDKWNDFLMSNLLGSTKAGAMLDRIMSSLARKPETAIVYPDDPGIMSWCENMEIALSIAKRMGVDALPPYFNFPVGSMFFMRKNLFQRFVALDYGWKDYSREPLPIDGTELHALERLFGAVAHVEGLGTAVTNIRGLTR